MRETLIPTMEDSTAFYIKEIGNHDLLTAEKEVELAKIKDQGLLAQQIFNENDNLTDEEKAQLKLIVIKGEEAILRFMGCNLKLSVSIARRFIDRGLPLLDLIQEGNIGLRRAAEKFDHEKGWRFSTYASWWIRQAITRAIIDQGRTIRLPVHMAEDIGKILKCKEKFYQETGNNLTEEQLVNELDINPNQLKRILEALNSSTISLDEIIPNDHQDDETTIGSFVEDRGIEGHPVKQLDQKIIEEGVAELLSGLPDKEREVLELRFGFEDGKSRTLDEIGTKFGVTRERIRQIEKKALGRLQKLQQLEHNTAQELLSYFE